MNNFMRMVIDFLWKRIVPDDVLFFVAGRSAFGKLLGVEKRKFAKREAVDYPKPEQE